jgi:hypothetical protein
MRELYVLQNKEQKLTDYEIGYHMASCPTGECQLLMSAYYRYIKPSHAEDSADVAIILDGLELRVNASNN